MKLALVIPSLDPARGGVERYALGLARGLAERGHRVTALTRTPRERLGPPTPGLQVHTLAVGADRFDAAVRARLGRLDAWDAVQGFGPTRVHTHHRIGGGSHAAYLRALARFEPGWLGWQRRSAPRQRRRVAAQRALLRQPGVRLLANSERSRRDVAHDYGIAPERVRVLHNGVDLEHFRPPPPSRDAARAPLDPAPETLAPDTLKVAFVGSGFTRKGLRFALGMLARARARGRRVQLLVAGRGATRRYGRLAAGLGVADDVRFLGPLADVAPLYRACDAFLLPSLYEAFGNAALEALACGLPVVLPAEAGVAEVCRDGHEGRLLSRPDALDEGAEFLCALADDPALRLRCGRHARHTAESLPLARHVDAMLALYAEGDALPS